MSKQIKSLDLTPKTLDDIVFAEPQYRELIEDIIIGRRPLPVRNGKSGILLFGPPGTGKTTLARMLPQLIEHSRFGESATHGYVPCTPEQNDCKTISTLQEQTKLATIFSNFHYFVLDEVDNLTDRAMKSLKSVMNVGNSVFVLTTNDISRIDAGVRDRCYEVPFVAANPEQWLPLCRRILNFHGIHLCDEEAMIQLIATCNGSARAITDAALDVALKSARLSQRNSVE